MAESKHLPVIAMVRQAYRLLWRHRALHLKAVWPPIVFLVAAEFLFHKVVGNAEGRAVLNALEGAPWYRLAAIVLLWLAGLKFLLSFSISWRRHILLGERFDPFFFQRPFWRYLGALLVLYLGGIVWILGLDLAELQCFGISFEINESGSHVYPRLDAIAFFVWNCVVCGMLLWGITRSVPRFSAMALGDDTTTLSMSWMLMHRNVLRYLAAWLLAMLPVIALSQLVGLFNHVTGIDVASTPVALVEASLRQACLFVHFSLGASLGMMTYAALVQERRPEAVA